MTFAAVRTVLLAAVLPPLAYYAGDLLVGEGMWPVAWSWRLSLAAALAAGLAAGAVARAPASAAALSRVLELLVRYGVAYLLLAYAINKIAPGQFVFYNRDLDLPLRDVPARRVAWHFLGYSRIYVYFMAGVEMLAAVLLCWPRTILAGLLLTAGATANIVVIDAAFGIRALPIPATMAAATLVLLGGYADRLRPLIWLARPKDGRARSIRSDLVSAAVVLLVAGGFLGRALWSTAGLRPPGAAGRWEIASWRADGAPAVMYLEFGSWGELVTTTGRRNLAFSYDRQSHHLEVRIDAGTDAADPPVVLSGVVTEADTDAVLSGSSPGGAPFDVRLHRTHRAPWPPGGWKR